MIIEGKWSASVQHDETVQGSELAGMVGLWDTGIDIHIDEPFVTSQGPIKNIITI
ncbi:MAG: hypothetical protein PHN90_13860 [Methanothrix sp.]|jgi:hypothetical protein|nr:hypothetical protein [Methanothrix sp.]